MLNKEWLRDPDAVSRMVVLGILALLSLGVYLFAWDIAQHVFELAISGNVNALVEYLRSFGPWAMVISFVLDVLINAGSIFPSIFISTANGLIFGLPMGILISWLAETVGVVISFYLMRFFFRSAAEKLIAKSEYLQKIDEVGGRNGLKWMAIARMMPYFPSGILTAVGALSSMSVRDYIIANLIGKFPSTALEVVIGHDLVNFEQHSQRLAVILTIGVAIFAVYKYYNKKRGKIK